MPSRARLKNCPPAVLLPAITALVTFPRKDKSNHSRLVDLHSVIQELKVGKNAVSPPTAKPNLRGWMILFLSMVTPLFTRLSMLKP